MRLSPRYDAPPVITVEVREPGPHAVVQQRRRLEAVVGELSDEEWRHRSRCDAWSAQDVLTHLISTNHFWSLSIAQALAGEPTRLLASFDPVATPAQMVDGSRGTPPEATLDAFRASNAELLDAVEALDAAGWGALGEAPPGHVPVTLVADHALWDSWVHERDILLPVGRTPVEDPREVLTCLRYAAALGSAFEVGRGRRPEGTVVLEITDLGARIVVSATGDHVRVDGGPAPSGARTVHLPAVPLLEMLSRRPAGQPTPQIVDWLAAGLAVVFDEAEVTESA